jgi:DNA-binding NtrC family response regulator
VKKSDFSILFADDNPSVKAIYVKAFTQEGYRVLSCDNAAQILADLKEEKVDLLVTDLEMPAANTLELFPTLKKEYPRLPVIVVSGHYRDLQQDFLARGYNIAAFIHKPTELSVLKEKIREVLKIDEK